MRIRSISRTFYRRSATIVAFLLCGYAITGSLRASDQTIQLIADNDFAVFAGTSTSVTRILYQNDVAWPDQIAAATSFSITLQGAEDTIYVLAMGGGGAEENLSGQINGVNIAMLYLQNSADVQASSNVAPYLSNYNVGNNVALSTYEVQLSEVQNALNELDWGAPTINSSQTVIEQNPYSDGLGFSFPTGNAVLFKFTAENLNIPEPSAAVFMSALALAFVAGVRRKTT